MLTSRSYFCGYFVTNVPYTKGEQKNSGRPTGRPAGPVQGKEFIMFELMPFARRENNLWNYLDNMEKNLFGGLDESFSSFRTDIVDQGDAFELRAELPGFKKEDIHIDVDGETLTVSAEHKEENEEKKDNYVRRERKYGSFSRSFDISSIDHEAIEAGYQDGILTLKLPKKAPVVPASRQIEIK